MRKTYEVFEIYISLPCKKNYYMAKDYPIEEPESPMVNEPAAEYDVAAKTTYRIISDEEMAQCIPLEESRRRLTEMIYKFYHPEA
jgi:hypothetical protein